MKRLSLLLLLLLTIVTVKAQEQEPIKINIDEKENFASYKQFGGFILDLNTELMQMPKLPEVKLMHIDPFPKFKEALQLDMSKVTYGVKSVEYGRSPYGFSRYGNSITDGPLNSATFRINDNLKFSTYGDYDAQGYRRVNPSAMPWERNNFRGAFELKSSSGFQIRLEVERKGSPYHW